MANLVTLEVEAPPDTVDVQVDFYDDAEKAALQSSALKDVFADLPRRITVPTQDLCTYYLYYKMRRGVDGFRSHTEVARRWHQALVEFDGQIKFGQSSFFASSLQDNSSGTIERVGEAIGLSVASKLHGLHQADWTRIPRLTTKTADFSRQHYASDSVHVVQVETKGSFTDKIALKSASISQHKASIKAKKAELKADGPAKTIMYGTIAVLDDQPGSVAQCWLVDPPARMIDNPRQFKILSRIEFMAELISMLSPRSALAISLQTHLASLQRLDDIMPLDRTALLGGSGKEIARAVETRYGIRNPWFSSKSVVSDGRTGGQIDLVSPDLIFFIGVREEVIDLAAGQSFSEIERYRLPAESRTETLECVVPYGRFRKEFERALNISIGSDEKRAGYVRFNLPAVLHYTQSGLVFGAVEVPEHLRRS